MNAATVTASVSTATDGHSELRLNANAQEGLIKQHTAPRAISRLLDAYREQTQRLPDPADLDEGWKPDPSRRFPDRYWDGSTWTRWTRDKPGGTRFEDAPLMAATDAARTAQPASSSIADELRKLTQLRDEGELTSEEFVALKQQLLGGQ